MKQPRGLSEISHLFLSSVRERQTGASARPVRKPPEPVKHSIDLTPEEFARVFDDSLSKAADAIQIPPVRAVLASHLGPRQFESAKRYAAGLAASGMRVGLIVVDSAEFHLMSFDADGGSVAADGTTCFDPRAMTDALNEMSCDLDCWVLLVSNTRVPEGRSLLRDVDRWVALSTCDHEGVVAAYRTVKGLSDVRCPGMSLAVLDPQGPQEAEQAFARLSATCSQFLNLRLEREPAVGDARQAGEVQVMSCRMEHDKAQLAAGMHWQVMAQFLSQARREINVPTEKPAAAPKPKPRKHNRAQQPPQPAPVCAQQPAGPPTPKVLQPEPIMVQLPPQTLPNPKLPEVIDLPQDCESEDSILAAVMRNAMTEVVECPVRPPNLQEARLAVSRDRRIVLIATTCNGLDELRKISQAYRWLVENRALLAMALPQLSMDAHQLPHLWLLVDRAESDAQLLMPLVQADIVRVLTYRQVRWGQKRGLLLDAA